jgi:hypothetical protein
VSALADRFLNHQGDEPSVTITFEGEGKGSVPLDETNFLWTSVLHVAQKEGKTIPLNARFALSIKNDIPLGMLPQILSVQYSFTYDFADTRFGHLQEGDWEAAVRRL